MDGESMDEIVLYQMGKINLEDNGLEYHLLRTGKAFIAGGHARDLIMKAKAQSRIPSEDIDVFLYDRKDFADYVIFLKSIGYMPQGESINAVNFENPDKEKVVQLIKPFENKRMKTFGQPVEVLDYFDFTLVKFAIWGKGYFCYHPEAIKDTEHEFLQITHINNPAAVMLRVIKYIQKTPTMRTSLKEILKLLDAWLTYPETSRKALTDLAKHVKDLDDESIVKLESLLRLAVEVEDGKVDEVLTPEEDDGF